MQNEYIKRKEKKYHKEHVPRIARCPVEFRFTEKSLSNALSLFTRFKILLHVPMAVPHFDPTKESTSLSSSKRFVLVGRPALTSPRTHVSIHTFKHTTTDFFFHSPAYAVGYVLNRCYLYAVSVHYVPS